MRLDGCFVASCSAASAVRRRLRSAALQPNRICSRFILHCPYIPSPQDLRLFFYPGNFLVLVFFNINLPSEGLQSRHICSENTPTTGGEAPAASQRAASLFSKRSTRLKPACSCCSRFNLSRLGWPARTSKARCCASCQPSGDQSAMQAG